MWAKGARAWKAGFKVVYVPRARIWHKSLKTKASELAMYYMTRNRFLFVKRNSSGFQLIVFNIFFLATDLILQMKNKLFMKPKLFIAYLKGIRDGLGTYSCPPIGAAKASPNGGPTRT